MTAKSYTVKSKSKTQPAVVMEAEVARKIRQHSRTSMKAEVCGVLIGSTDDNHTLIEACIPGINAAQGGAHVTFTQDTWEHIYKIKDRQYPDEKIVGWYHSHPGFGVFLSEHDLFIQENFFSSPHQVAWVYDPHTDEEGCFGWVGGKTEKLSGMRFGYSQSVALNDASANVSESNESNDEAEGEDEVAAQVRFRGEGPRREPPWVTWTIKVLAYVAALGLGFVGGYQFFFYRNAPALNACQQIVEHPIQACQEILQQFLPPMPRDTAPAAPQAQSPQQTQPPLSSPPLNKSSAGKGSNGKH